MKNNDLIEKLNKALNSSFSPCSCGSTTFRIDQGRKDGGQLFCLDCGAVQKIVDFDKDIATIETYHLKDGRTVHKIIGVDLVSKKTIPEKK